MPNFESNPVMLTARVDLRSMVILGIERLGNTLEATVDGESRPDGTRLVREEITIQADRLELR